MRARSSLALSLRTCRRPRRTSCRLLFAAAWLPAGDTLLPDFPLRCFARRGRHVSPRQLTFAWGDRPVRSSSLPSTRLVVWGCPARRHCSRRRCILARPCVACGAVLPWTTRSAASLSHGTSGGVWRLLASQARCRTIVARRGLRTPPCGVPRTRGTRGPSACGPGASSHRRPERRRPWQGVYFPTARLTTAWSRVSKTPRLARSLPPSYRHHRCRAASTACRADFPGRDPSASGWTCGATPGARDLVTPVCATRAPPALCGTPPRPDRRRDVRP